MHIATLDDIDKIVGMSMKFIDTTDYKEYSDIDTITLRVYNLISSPKDQGIILCNEDGFLAAQRVPFPFGKGFISTEIAWWVEPEARRNGVGQDLLDHYEHWVKNYTDCFAATMACLDDLTGDFLIKNNYKLLERAYMKVM